MFPSRSPYLRLSIILGLFVPAFVGGLFLAFNTGQRQHQPQHRQHHKLQQEHRGHQAQVAALKARQQAFLQELDLKKAAAEMAKTTPGAAGRKVHKVVEQMPLFPGRNCGDLADYQQRKQCADKAMLQYIYTNIKYPKRAKDRGVEGMVVVSFVIEPHGAISDIKIVRDPGSGLGAAAEKVVRKMYNDNLRWEPGLHKGKPVPVQFMLPVKFKLE